MNVPFEGIDKVYKSQADNKDIRDLLMSLVPKARKQMKDQAAKFRGRNERETVKRYLTT